jgi:hypothetical protein
MHKLVRKRISLNFFVILEKHLSSRFFCDFNEIFIDSMKSNLEIFSKHNLNIFYSIGMLSKLSLIAFKLGKEGRNVKIFIIPDSRWQF